MEEDGYQCPNCSENLSKKSVNRLRYLVFGVRPINCEHCGCKLQWPKHVRDKIKYYGYITNLGIIFGTYSLIGWLGLLPVFSDKDHMVGTILIAVGIGGIISRTKGEPVETVGKT